MCGIVGIVSLRPGLAVDAARLRHMRDVLRHRGPDGEGILVDGPVGLGHRRLAIVDVAGGHQPMSNEDGNVWIVLNGEIYNHASLRDELLARGHRYRTRSDTESILHLYEEEGERCVERLRGMFAFAIWDQRRRTLMLARDRLGIKPLYVAVTEDEICFASEIKAILAAGAVRPDFRRELLGEFLATRFASGEPTFFRGVDKLPPGTTLTWSAAEGIHRRRYWTPSFPVNGHGATLRGTASEVREGLVEAVGSHLMSDVPLGLFLSGGLDSSGLAAIMAAATPEPIRTFAVGFSDRGANELPYARLMARHVGAIHRDAVVSPEEFMTALPRLIWHEDEPIAFPASVPLYFVSRLAREDVTVVLTGEGADELFLGYNRYRVTAWNERLEAAAWRWLPGPLRRSVQRLVARLPAPARRRAERTFLALPPGVRARFFDNFAVFPESSQRELLADPGRLAGRDPYAEGMRLFAAGDDGGILERMCRVDLQTYLVELLMKQDQMSMATSLESRVPFLDHHFVEQVLQIPGRFKLRGLEGKAVLRAALRELVPPEIRARPKLGFPVPLARWFRGPYWPMLERIVLGSRAAARGLFHPAAVRRLAEEHRGGGRNHADRLWLLLNLELWQRIFLDGEDVGAVERAIHA